MAAVNQPPFGALLSVNFGHDLYSFSKTAEFVLGEITKSDWRYLKVVAEQSSTTFLIKSNFTAFNCERLSELESFDESHAILCILNQLSRMDRCMNFVLLNPLNNTFILRGCLHKTELQVAWPSWANSLRLSWLTFLGLADKLKQLAH